MSGWIKLEKDLETDPRVLRMAREIEARLTLEKTGTARGPVLPRNAMPLWGVTLCVGALARLWIYADSHAREDDSLDLSTAELDDILGVPGFCSLMPTDWLEVLGPHTVELPGFQAHNGVEAKRKDLNAKRQQRHRDKGKRTSVTARNAPALPDQTRPDQDQTKGKSTRRAASEKLPDETPDSDGQPDPHTLLELVRQVYPAGTYGGQNWILAERELSRLLEAGGSAREILAAAVSYRDQQASLGKVGSQYIRSPEKFYAGGWWRGPFTLPSANGSTPGSRIKTATDLAEEAEARAALAAGVTA